MPVVRCIGAVQSLLHPAYVGMPPRLDAADREKLAALPQNLHIPRTPRTLNPPVVSPQESSRRTPVSGISFNYTEFPPLPNRRVSNTDSATPVTDTVSNNDSDTDLTTPVTDTVSNTDSATEVTDNVSNTGSATEVAVSEPFDLNAVGSSSKMVIKCHEGRAAEDMVLNFPILSIDGNRVGYVMAVFDGHGCPQKTGQVQDHILRYIRRYFPTKMAEALRRIDLSDCKMVESVLKFTFSDFDSFLYQEMPRAGATCSMVLVTETHVFQVNLGDSRSCLMQGRFLISETADHKPNRPSETARIESVGGFVQNRRVSGVLATSRAFGDFSLKMIKGDYSGFGPVSAVPDVYSTPIKPNMWIIMGTDGLFDGFHSSSRQVIEYIHETISSKQNPTGRIDYTIDQLVTAASKNNNNDDIAVIIALL